MTLFLLSCHSEGVRLRRMTEESQKGISYSIFFKANNKEGSAAHGLSLFQNGGVVMTSAR